MRSSKSRSRSKTSRPRTLGNIINRVFDSSGPEGKVRGTPAQLIEKYQFLARDAQLSNDRVAAENFLQHAEHYTRLLAEANREMAAEQESRQQNQQSNNQNSGQHIGQNGGQNGGQNQQRERQQGDRDQRNDQRGEQRRDDRPDYRPDYRPEFRDVASDDQPVVAAHDLVDHVRDRDSGLVETPEAAPRPARNDEPRRNDRPRFDRPRDDRPRDDRPRDERPRDDRPRDDRPRDEPRRSYPPKVEQHQADRQEKPVETRQADPVAPAPPQPVARPKPTPKPAIETVVVTPTPTDAAPSAKPRTRAPRKPSNPEAKAVPPVPETTGE